MNGTDIEELWVEIPGTHSRYSVSNQGRVRNNDTDRILRQSNSVFTGPKVGFMVDGVQKSRIIRNLVAICHVDGRTEVFDTAINLDGDKSNNHASNLVWRPRWFAISYSRQFLPDSVWAEWLDAGPIDNLTTEVRYKTVRECAIAEGLLAEELIVAAYNKAPCFPHYHHYWIRNSV